MPLYIHYHKMFDRSMELGIIVVAFFAQVDEIFTGFWNHVTMQFQVNGSKIGDQPNIT